MRTVKGKALLFFAATSCLVATPALSEWDGFVALEGRAFLHGATYEEQDSSGLSLAFQPEYYHEFEGESINFTFIPFLRLDQYDDERTHADIRELNAMYHSEDFEFRAGIGKVFWGVAESRHLVDIINQDDLVEDVDGEEKLGQPMIAPAYVADYGSIQAFILPGFRERTFPGERGRLRAPIPVEEDIVRYESSQGERHVDYALRIKGTEGPFDVGVSHFYGTSREPRFNLGQDSNGGNVLIASYDIINQTGIDAQATFDALLLKFEGIYRTGQGEFPAIVAGYEYTFYGVTDSGADLGVLTEYLWDDRDERAPSTQFDNDIFFGGRLTLNDVESTEVLAGAIVDTNHATTGMLIEASRRLTADYKIEIDARIFTNTDEEDILYPARRDDHIQIRLSRYF